MKPSPRKILFEGVDDERVSIRPEQRKEQRKRGLGPRHTQDQRSSTSIGTLVRTR